MQFITRLFTSFTKPYHVLEKEREEAYLADSADLYELEYRLRRLDRDKVTRHPGWMAQG